MKAPIKGSKINRKRIKRAQVLISIGKFKLLSYEFISI